MARLIRAAALVMLVACGGGDDGGGDGAADAEPVCAPPVGTYETDVLAGKGTCDPERFLPSFLPLGELTIDEQICGPFVAATYGLADACDGTAELSVVLTEDGPTDGRIDFALSDCSDDGGECTYVAPVELTLVGGRP